jgi:ketosteroid isomerase-like protein
MEILYRVMMSENGQRVLFRCGNLVTPKRSRPMKTISTTNRFGSLLWAVPLLIGPAICHAASTDERTVAALDTEYQAAVLHKDAAAIDRLLPADFVLVTGKGIVHTKGELLDEARGKDVVYERQDDSNQGVRIWGDTAVVTALLYVKGSENGKPFEYKLWFSDLYLRTPKGWRYTFGQASIRLPSETP